MSSAATPNDLQKAIDAAQSLITFIFSWVVLLGISVIIAGKLTAKYMALDIGGDDLFSINLIAFRIKAKGDEVSLGFVIFVLSLVFVILTGGRSSYEIF